MPAAARLNDTGKGHDCFPDTSIVQGSPDVTINGQPAARQGDALAPHACPCPNSPHGMHSRVVSAGSSTVTINGKPAARISDAVSCGGTIITGSNNVFIGDTLWQSPARECAKQAALSRAPLLGLSPGLTPLEVTPQRVVLSR